MLTAGLLVHLASEYVIVSGRLACDNGWQEADPLKQAGTVSQGDGNGQQTVWTSVALAWRCVISRDCSSLGAVRLGHSLAAPL